MKKFLLVFVLLLVSFVMVACGEGEVETIDPTNYKIAMITDKGDIDDKSFNQGTWEGIVEYATENDKEHAYFRPADVSTADYVETIEYAIGQGYKIIVTPGFLFEEAIYAVQNEHKDVFFILLDGAPHSGNYVPVIAENTLSIFFSEHESGWLAGYAAVKDGFEELGFMGGMAVPAVVRFGVGFVGGAYYAAYEMEQEDFAFPALNYEYLGDFAPSDEFKTKATAMYNRGVEVIHAAAGGAGNSVMAAAEELTNKWVIGVDIDQSAQSTRVISSALKGLAVAVQNGLSDIYGGNFQGGRSISLGAAQDAVGLPVTTTAVGKFTTFTVANYNLTFSRLAAGVIGAPSSPEQLGKYIAALGYTVPTGLVSKASGS